MTTTIDRARPVTTRIPPYFEGGWAFGVPRTERHGTMIVTMGTLELEDAVLQAMIVLDAIGDEDIIGAYQVTYVAYLDGDVERTISFHDDASFFDEARFSSFLPIGVSSVDMTTEGHPRADVQASDLTVNIGGRDLHPQDMEQIFAITDKRIAARRAENAGAIADGSIRYENVVSLSLDHREAIGDVRYGGLPDMAADQVWPADADGKPLDFVAQINLAHMAGIAKTGLPASGTLSIFYDLTERPWGIEPKEQASLRIIHATGAVEPRDLPEGVQAIAPIGMVGQGEIMAPSIEAYATSEFAVLEARAWIKGGGLVTEEARAEIYQTMRECGVASWDMETQIEDVFDEADLILGDMAAPEGHDMAPDISKIDPDDDEAMARAIDAAADYHADINDLDYASGPISTMLLALGGYANTIQCPMEEDVHELSQALHAVGASSLPSDWVHLLTLHEGGVIDMYDAGRIYVWVKKDDLAAADFSRVIYQLQCG